MKVYLFYLHEWKGEKALIKAIIFDFDGLIIDTETPWFEAYKETLGYYNVDLPLEHYVKSVGSDNTVLYEFFKQQLGESCNIEEIDAKAESIYKEKMKAPQAREGVKDYLQEANDLGYKIAIASSSTREWVTHYLDELGVLNYFNTIITQDDVEKVKPAPDLYLKAVDALNISSNEALAFEDSLNGLQAALAAGLKCVIVPNPVTESLPFENYDLRLQSMAEKSLSDVIKLIEQ
ncbi:MULTISPECIES: HAD family hydrolase [Aeribacillus]|jgi:haloacid dehalogenase superfamily, subfamily IA, variant 3 with third motif having DD or ED|uniref:HAD family hydrolase n=1 Tax=Aeribacillus TaxID=1055323 RepID=UPI001F5E3415|nr:MULTISPECIES: HAD family hydrolase [Aeribacillus]MED0702677.1 HAD family hydrolase [Aeribacillus composti]